MDMGDKLEVDKRREDSANYHHTSPVPPDWSNFSNSSSMRMTSEGNPIGPSHSSMGSIVNSFVPPIWDHPSSAHSLGYSGVQLQNVASFPDTLVQTREFPSSLRSGLDNSGWDVLNSMLKGGLVLPNVSAALPHSLSQFPADSAFIERAARFSCFSTNIADTANPFGIHQSAVSPYSHGGVNIPPGTQEAFRDHVTEAGCGGQLSEHGMTNQALAEQDVPLGTEKGSNLEAERKTEGFDDESKPGDSDEAETAGGEDEELSLMDTATEPSSSKRPGSKKRQRGGRDSEMGQHQEQHVEAGKDTGGKLSCSPPSTKNNSGRNGKQISQSSDKSKGEYIHVRARRGQATNSHSLAERVRREKISERMKFLQDLVPGCSKVTGKAVMLDEIINYVQSLQRQVEFLSMKLATVNPRLDFNIESLLAKDPMLCARAGPSQLGFSPDTMHITYPPMHPPQQSLVQPGLPPIGPSPSDALRNMSPQLMDVSTRYKEPTSQLPNVWDDDDLQNVVHMGLNQTAANTGSDGDDTNGSLQSGRMKAEH